MQLNPDCIRDLLLIIEENTSYKIDVTYPSECFEPLLAKYDDLQLRYHILQLSKAKRIEPVNIDDWERITIPDLTPEGHELLANIRSDTVWKKTLKIFLRIGTQSISLMNTVSGTVLSSLITDIIKSRPL